MIHALVVGLVVAGPNVLAGAQQSTPEPAWLLTERADAAADDGEYGQAIRLYRQVLGTNPNALSAHEGLAEAFAATADLDLALDHFKRAAELAAAAGDRPLEARLLLRLTDLLWTKQLFKEYSDILTGIAADDPALRETEFADITERLASVFATDGANRVLVLYRLSETYATEAHSRLAVFLVQSGRYRSAMAEALLAVTAAASTVIDELIRFDPLYEFSTLGDALDRAREDAALGEYLATTTLYRDLYYLAAAAYGLPSVSEQRSVDVWRLLADQPAAGIWARRAAAQVRSPSMEPILFSDLE